MCTEYDLPFFLFVFFYPSIDPIRSFALLVGWSILNSNKTWTNKRTKEYALCSPVFIVRACTYFMSTNSIRDKMRRFITTIDEIKIKIFGTFVMFNMIIKTISRFLRLTYRLSMNIVINTRLTFIYFISIRQNDLYKNQLTCDTVQTIINL